MPRKLIVLAFIAILVLPIASSGDVSELDKYLDCLTDKKADIVFVFDTTNSMGGEINELRTIANKFASDLEAYRIDYRLGLVEFRDFPLTCGEGKKIQCGSQGDFAYRTKGNGTLTSEISTFSSWLDELKAGGGGSGGPEAVLAALNHAGRDLSWRNEAEKRIIVLTDAGVHPDGSCCNAEGDTLEGTILGLTGLAARVYVIGPDDSSLNKIAKDTGGQFFEIRSGLSLRPLLDEITQSMSCTFNATVEAICQGNKLEATVKLTGREVIPYVTGLTESWMYLDQSGNSSRYNLKYDQAAGGYKIEVPDICGSVNITVYGRVGERSAVKTVKVDCGTCEAGALEQGAMSISGRVFDDRNGDGTKDVGETDLRGWNVTLKALDGHLDTAKTDENGYYNFTGLSPGSYDLGAKAQENWTATVPKEGVQEVELDDTHESEINIGFRYKKTEDQPRMVIEQFNKTFGGSGLDWASSVQQTTDGGYVIAGTTESYSAGSYDAWLIKTDSAGNELWNRTFGGPSSDGANYVTQTTDGGYIIAGDTLVEEIERQGTLSVHQGGDYQAWLIKTDSSGKEQWNRTFGGSDNDRAESVQQTTDGGYIIAGQTYPIYPAKGEWSYWQIKTDSEGNKLQENSSEAHNIDERSVRTNDGGYIEIPFSSDLRDVRLIKYAIVNVGTLYIFGRVFDDSDGDGVRDADEAGLADWDVYLNGPNEYSTTAKTDGNGYYNFAGLPPGSYDLGAVVRENWTATSPAEIGEDVELVNANESEIDFGFKLTFGSEASQISSEQEEIVPSSTVEQNWRKTFGGAESDSGSAVQLTSDGGYIIAGDTESYGAGRDDAWLIKTDSSGNELWNKTLGGAESDYSSSFQQTSDGGYIIAGSTESFGEGGSDAWLIKTDSNGNKLWDKTFGGAENDSASSVQQTSDGGYIIIGETESFAEDDRDPWLIRIDGSGNKLWDRTFNGGGGYEKCSDVKETSDGGYIIVGFTWYGHNNTRDLWLIKTDSSGNKLWDKTFGGSGWFSGDSVQQTSNGGYIIIGQIESLTGLSDLGLIKTDVNANKLWDKAFDRAEVEWGREVRQVSDGGYIIIGCTGSTGVGGYDLWLIKTDGSGNKIWDRTFGKAERDDYGSSVRQTSDGGYIITGQTESFGMGNGDLWLIKTDDKGNA